MEPRLCRCHCNFHIQTLVDPHLSGCLPHWGESLTTQRNIPLMHKHKAYISTCCLMVKYTFSTINFMIYLPAECCPEDDVLASLSPAADLFFLFTIKKVSMF